MHDTAIVMHRSAQRDTFAMLTHRRGGGEGGAAFIDNRTDSWGAIVTKELGLLAGKTRPLIAFSSFSNLFQFHSQLGQLGPSGVLLSPRSQNCCSQWNLKLHMANVCSKLWRVLAFLWVRYRVRYGAHNVDADNHSSNEDDDGGGKEIDLVVLWIYKMRSTGEKCKGAMKRLLLPSPAATCSNIRCKNINMNYNKNNII